MASKRVSIERAPPAPQTSTGPKPRVEPTLSHRRDAERRWPRERFRDRGDDSRRSSAARFGARATPCQDAKRAGARACLLIAQWKSLSSSAMRATARARAVQPIVPWRAPAQYHITYLDQSRWYAAVGLKPFMNGLNNGKKRGAPAPVSAMMSACTPKSTRAAQNGVGNAATSSATCSMTADVTARSPSRRVFQLLNFPAVTLHNF